MWILPKTGSGAEALIIPVSLVECEMRGKTAVGARTTQAYQMLAVDAACAGPASHEAVKELPTLLMVGRTHLQRRIRVTAFELGEQATGGLVGDEIKRP